MGWPPAPITVVAITSSESRGNGTERLVGGPTGRVEPGQLGPLLDGQAVGAGADPVDVDRGIRVPSSVLGPSEQDRGGAIAHRATIVEPEGFGDAYRAEDRLPRDLLLEVGVRVQRPVRMVLDRDLGEGLGTHPVLRQVPVGQETVDAGEREPRGSLPFGVARDPQPVAAPGAGHVGHLLEPGHEHEVDGAGLERADARAHRKSARRARVLDPRRGDPHDPRRLRQDRGDVPDLPAPEADRREEELLDLPSIDPSVDARERPVDRRPEEFAGAGIQDAELGVAGPHHRRSVPQLSRPANRLNGRGSGGFKEGGETSWRRILRSS